MRAKPIEPRMDPSASPLASSRRMTRNQSRSRTSPSAMARITSEVACDPELPPLEMMSGTNSASTTALAISFSKNPIAVAVSIAEEERGEPAGALPQHAGEGDGEVGLAQRLGAAHLLDVLGRLFADHLDHVVDGDDALHPPLRI